MAGGRSVRKAEALEDRTRRHARRLRGENACSWEDENESEDADEGKGTDIAASRWSAGIVRCSTGRDSHATRFTFIKCCGPMLSDVMLPPRSAAAQRHRGK